jgi:hypothetical protein
MSNDSNYSVQTQQYSGLPERNGTVPARRSWKTPYVILSGVESSEGGANAVTETNNPSGLLS